MSVPDHHDKTWHPFSPLIFVIVIVISLSAALLALAFFSPSIWSVQLKASLWSLAATFAAAHLCYAFVEFFFHRYVLHMPVIPFLAYFYRQHTQHHALTSVALQKTSVRNVYPILTQQQHEASFFPPYSFFVFALIFTPALLAIQWFMPRAPIMLGGYIALAWSLCLYELLHAIEHLPLNKWEPLLSHPTWGKMWMKLYGFHLRHHAEIRSNESISGFFGIPIPDLVFGTYVDPKTLYQHGETVPLEKFEPPTPRFISWLDRWCARIVKKRRLAIAMRSSA
ncbi:MAG: hypothetical protein M3Q63_02540 [bacterium]|nr:hypothetical protein [bacterium]